MNQIFAIAIGGAGGAVLRYLVSNGVYGWLGKDFPYGTLTVNVIGSFLLGLMSTAMLLERVVLAEEFSLALLVGCFGSFTTFSTFSLDTLSLLEQGQVMKALSNILINVVVCIVAVWLGLKIGQLLHQSQNGIIHGLGISFPFAFACVVFIVSSLIGLIAKMIMYQNGLDTEVQATTVVFAIGFFITFSSVYLVMYILEMGIAPSQQLSTMLGVLLGNTALCALGTMTGIQIARLFQ
ncbi:MAG: fluoride efflux transporter CrcB [Gammaproteobacteria bacterium]|nr:fluoride efflux transporter CrcB [Gammaproteobacteria bacterium]